MFRSIIPGSLLIFSALHAAEPVTIDNFVRAETDTMLRANLAAGMAKVGEFVHQKQPASVEVQPVIRQNRDTLYSGTILDLSAPIVITLPDADGRYMSLHVINQDHYMFVETEPGDYELTEENVGTRFAAIIVRTFADPNDPDDIAAANAAQDALRLSGGGTGPFEAPEWDQGDLTRARRALNELSTLGFDYSYAFGLEDEVKPVDHLVGAASGWGGLPAYAAEYTNNSVDDNDGEVSYSLTAKDVPVDAFWSITVYNAEGYMEPNDADVYSFNNVTASVNDDGSQTIHFGRCEDGRINCIPITPGWNYTVRMYMPREEIRDGSWIFPTPEKVD